MNLHSNMVRFIIRNLDKDIYRFLSFTFQYGQIYYKEQPKELITIQYIYIPIWLDLLYEADVYKT